MNNYIYIYIYLCIITNTPTKTDTRTHMHNTTTNYDICIHIKTHIILLTDISIHINTQHNTDHNIQTPYKPLICSIRPTRH